MLHLILNGGLPAVWAPSRTAAPAPGPEPPGLGRQLLNAAEPLSSGLIKNHITDLVLFFSLPDLMKTKQEEVGREEGGEVEVNCLMETLSLNI